jgi:pilus assembly protein CpaC
MPIQQVGWMIALSAVLSASGWAGEGDSRINLGVGSQKLLTIPDISRIAVGDSSVADVKNIGNNQILIIGAGEGKTTLLVWRAKGHRKSYAISVKKQDPSELVSEIRNLIGGMEGVTVRMVGIASTWTAGHTPHKKLTAFNRWPAFIPISAIS